MAQTGFIPLSSLTGSSSGSSPNVSVTGGARLSVPGGASVGMVINMTVKNGSGAVVASWPYSVTQTDINNAQFSTTKTGLAIAAGSYSLTASTTVGMNQQTAGPVTIAVS